MIDYFKALVLDWCLCQVLYCIFLSGTEKTKLFEGYKLFAFLDNVNLLALLDV